MPQLANITINDGESTPVAHVFAPVTTDGFLARLKERVGAIASVFPSLNVQFREPLNGQRDRVYRIKETIQMPVAVTIDGVVSIDHTDYAHVEYVISERSSEQQRKNLRMLVSNSQANATLATVVDKLEPLY